MTVVRWHARAREDYTKNYPSGGAMLKTPRTPVEKIVLSAKLMKLKADYLKRHPEDGS